MDQVIRLVGGSGTDSAPSVTVGMARKRIFVADWRRKSSKGLGYHVVAFDPSGSRRWDFSSFPTNGAKGQLTINDLAYLGNQDVLFGVGLSDQGSGVSAMAVANDARK